MGALKGTLTYTTYYVENEPGEGFREVLIQELERHRHREIDVEAGHDQSLGWVVLGAPWSREFTWDKVFVDPYICVSLRNDRIRIPATTLRAYMAEREAILLDERGGSSLDRKERKALKDDLLMQLRRRAIPDIKVFDVMWNVQEGILRFWAQNRGMCDAFEELVHRSWGLKLIPQSPYSAATRYVDEPKVEAAILELDPSDFAGAEVA